MSLWILLSAYYAYYALLATKPRNLEASHHLVGRPRAIQTIRASGGANCSLRLTEMHILLASDFCDYAVTFSYYPYLPHGPIGHKILDRLYGGPLGLTESKVSSRPQSIASRRSKL